MSRIPHIAWWLRFVGLCLILQGCGGTGHPKLVPVTGLVTLDGRQLAGADVTFMPIGETRGAGSHGRTGPDGRYSLTAVRGGRGAVPGTYKVIISKRLMPDGSEVPPNDPTPPIESPAREHLPRWYSDRQASELTANVPENGGSVDFPLASQKPAP